jgi:regulatory protein
VAPVLDRLTEVGLVDDRAYARVYLERRAASRPRGARLLRGELLAKGVPADVADEALAERRDATDPVEDALKALRPWLPRNLALEPRERRRKLWQFLARRGFSSDVIERAALKVQVSDSADDEL